MIAKGYQSCIMVKFENRIHIAKENIQKLYHLSFVEEDSSIIVDRNILNSDPMVNRKLEICNDVERNPGPNGGKTPINDNPRVLKIG